MSLLFGKFTTLRWCLALLLRRISNIVPRRVKKRLYHDREFSARFEEKLIVFKGTKNSFENSIFWYGIYDSIEGLSLQSFLELVRRKKSLSFWDIGANSGIYSLATRSLRPDCKVVAFEPSKGCFRKLVENVQCNSFPYVMEEEFNSSAAGIMYLANFALGNKDGVEILKYVSSTTSDIYGGQVQLQGINPAAVEEVRMKTPQSFIDQYPNLVPNVLKLDIEGFEPFVLSGFANYLEKVELILIEILTDDAASKIQELLPATRFVYFDIDDSGKRIRNEAVLRKSSYRNWIIIRKSNIDMLNAMNLIQSRISEH